MKPRGTRQAMGPDLLRTGIFTAGEAAALIGVTPQKIRGWVDGWPKTSAPPLVDNDLGWLEGKLAFSFANLMELHFIAFFERAHVKLNEIRSIMDEVRVTMKRPHPFATNLVFKTDGVRIVAEVARHNGIPDLYDLRSKNWEMQVVVYQSLKDDIRYDPAGNAEAWFPRREIAPNVIIHPKLAFGRPVLKGVGIPTETIADAVRAEGSEKRAAAVWEIPVKRVEEAVRFEAALRRAA